MIQRYNAFKDKFTSDGEFVYYSDHEADKAEAVLAERKRIVEILEWMKGRTYKNCFFEQKPYDTDTLDEAISKIEEEV